MNVRAVSEGPVLAFFKLNLFLWGIIADPHAFTRNDQERSHVPFTQFLPVVSCITVVQ